jgi:hypothetical protein
MTVKSRRSMMRRDGGSDDERTNNPQRLNTI